MHEHWGLTCCVGGGPRSARGSWLMEASHQAILARNCTHEFIIPGADAVVLLLQPRGGCQEALLVISNQVDPKTGDELTVGSAEGCQPGTKTTVVDLRCNVLGRISVHLITETIEPVFQKCLGCCEPFMTVERCLNVNQGNPQVLTDIWDCNWIGVVLGKIVMNSEHDLVPLVGVQWMGVMVDVEQLSLLLLHLSAAV